MLNDFDKFCEKSSWFFVYDSYYDINKKFFLIYFWYFIRFPFFFFLLWIFLITFDLYLYMVLFSCNNLVYTNKSLLIINKLFLAIFQVNLTQITTYIFTADMTGSRRYFTQGYYMAPSWPKGRTQYLEENINSCSRPGLNLQFWNRLRIFWEGDIN